MTIIADLHDGVILLLRPECFVKIFCYSVFFSPGSKETFVEICLTVEATQSSLIFAGNEFSQEAFMNKR